MKANELHEHMKGIGEWVDWGKTCDGFLWGDPSSEVDGIAVSWTTAKEHLERALKLGCNLYVCHEPLYHYSEAASNAHAGEVEKARFLKKSPLVIYRCHDVWDVMPRIGIVDSWSEFLGFTGRPAAAAKYYNAHDLPAGTTLKSLAGRILSRVRELGQEVVHILGDPNQKLTRLAVGTGAITSFRAMAPLGADVLLVTDDGTRLWESAVWSQDTKVPLIILNHATAEEPGMRNMAKYLREQFPVRVELLPQGCLYRTVT